MKEHEIRQRIEGFLKRAAREVVVPASVGVGLALIGCDQGGLKTSLDAAADRSAAPDGILADATLGNDRAVNVSDTANPRDLRLPDATQPAPDTRGADLPAVMPPYMVFIPPDAGVDAGASDAGLDTGASDAGLDAGASDARLDARLDAGASETGRDTLRAELPSIMPPYLGAPPPDAARDLPPIAPPYIAPPPVPIYNGPQPPPPPDASQDVPTIVPPYLYAPLAPPAKSST
jgi:hypothetical protein